jgi:hypothetical protein
LTIVTCGIFYWVWAFVQAVWLRKVQPQAKALYYLLAAVGVDVVAIVLSTQKEFEAFGSLLNLVAAVVFLCAVFSMRSSIEDHYNSSEPIGLTLSGVMTFFFGIFYFQYHFTRIVNMKRSGQLSMARGA